MYLGNFVLSHACTTSFYDSVNQAMYFTYIVLHHVYVRVLFTVHQPFTKLSSPLTHRSLCVRYSYVQRPIIAHCSSGKVEHFRDCIRYFSGVTYLRLVTLHFRQFFIYSVKCRIVKMFIQNRFCGLDTDDHSRYRILDIFTNVCTHANFGCHDCVNYQHDQIERWCHQIVPHNLFLWTSSFMTDNY